MSLCRFLLILFWILTEYKLVWTFDTVPVVDVQPVDQLACWACKHAEGKPNPNCVTMMNSSMITKSKCRVKETYCKIGKRTSNSHVEWFERSCAIKCEPLCQQFKTLKQCNWCCNSSFCNVGSSGERLLAYVSTLTLLCVFSFYTTVFERLK